MCRKYVHTWEDIPDVPSNHEINEGVGYNQTAQPAKGGGVILNRGAVHIFPLKTYKVHTHIYSCVSYMAVVNDKNPLSQKGAYQCPALRIVRCTDWHS